MESLPRELRLKAMREVEYPHPQLSRQFVSDSDYTREYREIRISKSELEKATKGRLFAITRFAVGNQGKEAYTSLLLSPTFYERLKYISYIEIGEENDKLYIETEPRIEGRSIIYNLYEDDPLIFMSDDYDLVTLKTVFMNRRSLAKRPTYAKDMLQSVVERKYDELSSHEYYREVLHVWLATQCTLLGIDPHSRLIINEEFTFLPGEHTSSHENDLLLEKIYEWIESC